MEQAGPAWADAVAPTEDTGDQPENPGDGELRGLRLRAGGLEPP